MWGIITGGIVEVVKGWFEVKKSKQEAEKAYNMQVIKGEQDYDIKAMEAAKYSWKDEFITIIIFSPMIVAWFDQDRAMDWIEFVTELPYWYQIIMFGIVAASFGLRWWFKSQSFSVMKK